MPYDLNNPQLDFDLENQIQKAAFLRGQKMEDQKTKQYTGRKFSTPYQPMTGIGDALTNLSGESRREDAEQHMRTLGTEEERRLMALTSELNAPQNIDYTNQQALIEESARRANIAQKMSMLPKGRKAAEALLKDANAFPLTMGKTGQQQANLTGMQEARQQHAGSQRELTAQANSDLSLQEHLQNMERDASKPVAAAAGSAKSREKSAELAKLEGIILNAQTMLEDRPQGVGWKTLLHDNLLQRTDPDGVALRAALAGLSADKIHELSGAAVSAKEYERLAPYLPAAGNDAATVRKKLDGLMKEIDLIKSDRTKVWTPAPLEPKLDSGTVPPIPPVIGNEVDQSNLQEQQTAPAQALPMTNGASEKLEVVDTMTIDNVVYEKLSNGDVREKK